MMTRAIIKAQYSDLPQISERYTEARAFMAQNGNPDQWGRTGYPKAELLRQDVASGRLFAVREGNDIIGAFVLVFGPDPTYAAIKDGAWPDDKPYGTLHRLCAATKAHGVAAFVLDFCEAECKRRGADLRADTHAANKPMQHILEKAGFTRCGTIFVADGSPRIAYQKMI